MNIQLILIFLVAIFASTNSDASHSYKTKDIHINNIGMSTSDFIKYYKNTDPRIRERSKIYLLGVMDASEGTLWCGYNKYKTITVYEKLFFKLSSLAPPDLNQRASSQIIKILSASYPCGK
jgi:hypothetical protein